MDITFEKTEQLRAKPSTSDLGFGTHFADYMFEMDYKEGQGWINPKIIPYGPICLDPSAMVLHYGQSVFEGLKAYTNDKSEVLLFRPEKNMERLNRSCRRLCIPELDESFILDALKELVKVNKDWIPKSEGASLYMRPFVFANEECLGVHAARSYKFMILASPVAAYYSQGFHPLCIYIENHYVRAVRGGMGEAKTAGNYAASIKAQDEAQHKRVACSQVLWLDGVEQKYIEEVGAMNVFFKINGEIVTPALTGSILDGITRDSVIQLLRADGYAVTERRIAVDELLAANASGELEEMFGTGTAAVISPVGSLFWKGDEYLINKGAIGEVSQMLFDKLSNIQRGELKEAFGWSVKIS